MDTFDQTKPQTLLQTYLQNIDEEKIICGDYKPETIFKSKAVNNPKFSVIMRTQGTRISLMEQAILCLLAQEFQDFELVIVGHNIEKSKIELVEKLISDFGNELADKTTFVAVSGGKRGVPMNVGIKSAKGSYIVFLDDDDLVFAHWLSTFEKYSTDNPNKIIRSRCVDRYVEQDSNESIPSYVTSGLEDVRSGSFSLSSHFFISQTVLHQYATPRQAIIDNCTFVDESLPVVEDWDFLLRNSEELGVVDTGQITGIYNRWTNKGSSLHEVDASTWSDYHRKIFMRFNDRGILIPPGELLTLYRLWLVQDRFREFGDEVLIDGDKLTINKKINALQRQIQYLERKETPIVLTTKELVVSLGGRIVPSFIKKIIRKLYRIIKRITKKNGES